MRQPGGDRADVDDAAAAGGLHRLGLGAHAAEDADEIGLEHHAQLVGGGVEHAADARRAGRVDRQRSGPKRADGRRDRGLDRRSSVTSQTTHAAAAPSSAAASRTTCSRRPPSITVPPPATMARAQASPIPLPPPVTKAALSANRLTECRRSLIAGTSTGATGAVSTAARKRREYPEKTGSQNFFLTETTATTLCVVVRRPLGRRARRRQFRARGEDHPVDRVGVVYAPSERGGTMAGRPRQRTILTPPPGRVPPRHWPSWLRARPPR